MSSGRRRGHVFDHRVARRPITCVVFETFGSRWSLTQAVANGVNDLAGRRHEAEDHHRSAVDDNVAVDEHLVLTVAPVDRVDVDPELASQPRRRTDGVNAGDSKGAIANDNSHGSAPWLMAFAESRGTSPICNRCPSSARVFQPCERRCRRPSAAWAFSLSSGLTSSSAPLIGGYMPPALSVRMMDSMPSSSRTPLAI